MSLYSLYIKERENKEIIENEQGFISYLELDDSKTIYVSDFFIKKEYRNKGTAKKFCNKLEEVAKKKNYKYAMASIDMSTKNWEHSKNILKSYGFKFIKKQDTMEYFLKEINYGI